MSLMMTINTVLARLIALRWSLNPLFVLACNGLFPIVNQTFFSAYTLKLFEGGRITAAGGGRGGLPDADQPAPHVAPGGDPGQLPAWSSGPRGCGRA